MIVDAHCDALYKLFSDPKLDFKHGGAGLDVSAAQMADGRVKLQFFAVYLSEQLEKPSFDHVLKYIDIFYRQVCKGGGLVPVRNKQELLHMWNTGQSGAILSLEGADALAADPVYLRTLYYLGVRFIGITWNYANWAADGIMEPRKGGFTRKGKWMIEECEQLGILLDVSHLSVKGFWELAEWSNKPFIASHSNAKALCSHPRNLDDEQIKAIVKQDGIIGITFVPWFVKDGGNAAISDVLKHIDHMGSLGAANHIGFGSDFDGIDQWVSGLEHAGKYGALAEQLVKHYTQEQAEAFLWGNWKRFLYHHLP